MEIVVGLWIAVQAIALGVATRLAWDWRRRALLAEEAGLQLMCELGCRLREGE